jgi:DNA-binding response OmpR family regulator
LSGEGMSVDWVRDGTDAEAALSDSGYAIVLLDLAPALSWYLQRCAPG